MPVWIGTSGWQYRDWRGRFYPDELAQARWLTKDPCPPTRSGCCRDRTGSGRSRFLPRGCRHEGRRRGRRGCSSHCGPPARRCPPCLPPGRCLRCPPGGRCRSPVEDVVALVAAHEVVACVAVDGVVTAVDGVVVIVAADDDDTAQAVDGVVALPRPQVAPVGAVVKGGAVVEEAGPCRRRRDGGCRRRGSGTSWRSRWSSKWCERSLYLG